MLSEAREYSDTLVRQQILCARKFKRKKLLNKKPKEDSGKRLVLNITYHPAYARIKDILSSIHLLLTPNEKHRNVFPKVPLVGSKRDKSLQNILVRAKLPKTNIKDGSCCKYQGSRCVVYNYIKDTNTFSDKDLTKTYTIKGGSLNCNTSNVVYLVQCKTCHIQYIGSASTKFRLRFNNYRCCY